MVIFMNQTFTRKGTPNDTFKNNPPERIPLKPDRQTILTSEIENGKQDVVQTRASF